MTQILHWQDHAETIVKIGKSYCQAWHTGGGDMLIDLRNAIDPPYPFDIVARTSTPPGFVVIRGKAVYPCTVETSQETPKGAR